MSNDSFRMWIGWGTAVCATLVVAGLVVAPPYASVELRQTIMAAFARFCHQIPERSPHLNGVQLAVCHRCTGMYLGLAAAAACFLPLRRWDDLLQRYARYAILGAVLVPGIDWAVDVLGIWTNTPFSRFLTGGIFGIIVGLYFTRAMIGLIAGKSWIATGARIA